MCTYQYEQNSQTLCYIYSKSSTGCTLFYKSV
uniref:Uncharacterized protein n=1 Tax=Anguilla anguilla TaxID=7936 RepID=A0A0E9V5L9_ANGAN